MTYNNADLQLTESITLNSWDFKPIKAEFLDSRGSK